MSRGKTVAQFWRDVDRAVAQAKESAVREAAKVVYTATLEELAKGSPGKGRVYKRGKGKAKRDARGRYSKRGLSHQASRSGDAPARDTGNLIRSIDLQLHRGRDPTAEVGVKRTAPYGKFLDPPEGRKDPKIGRRPFLSSAWRKSQGEVKRVIRRELERGLRKLHS